ncbi:MAG: 23S rRNA (pseudouridine(1915)-N(3))-methyltransferase RlmH [Clostridia bacterium]|nr:23S rRNA (pseudouridine(1915)-N(3))-methyltransferase RlmH [Clostridiales bacterium]MBQ6803222.1 23S rRNA (pseudouridine(1915)-N(3))-methyltransferase RlmH [Clostridia bacterium]
MNGAIICVGKLREKYFAGAAEEYLKRLSRFGKFEIIELPDLPEPQNASAAQQMQIMEKEGENILSRIRQGDRVIAMCIDGPQYDSESFARHLAENEMKGGRQVFVIGGSLGLSKAVIQRADEKISLSKMTFPHQLARVLLLEQIYRACKINAGERYHK